MAFSESLLGKPLNSLTYEDINNFFSQPREESDKIEFKSFASQSSLDKHFEVVYKAVTAFLNSDGGIMIWGAPTGQTTQGKKEKIFQGLLKPLNISLGADQLINKISDNITPLPKDFKARILSSDNNSVVVIEVQKSQYAPHQTNNTYYMRLDGQSRAAPHHYIEALFKRITYPNIEGYIKFNSLFIKDGKYSLSIEIIIMNASPLQNEYDVSMRLISHHGVFYYSTIPVAVVTRNYPMNGKERRESNIASILHYGMDVINEELILFNESEIHKQNYEVRLTLIFGGKLSPLKRSDYKLNLSNYKSGEDINSIIINSSENVMFVDTEPHKSKEKLLKVILGR